MVRLFDGLTAYHERNLLFSLILSVVEGSKNFDLSRGRYLTEMWYGIKIMRKVLSQNKVLVTRRSRRVTW